MPAHTETEFRAVNPRGRDKRNPYRHRHDEAFEHLHLSVRRHSPGPRRVGNGEKIEAQWGNGKLIRRVPESFQMRKDSAEIVKYGAPKSDRAVSLYKECVTTCYFLHAAKTNVLFCVMRELEHGKVFLKYFHQTFNLWSFTTLDKVVTTRKHPEFLFIQMRDHTYFYIDQSCWSRFYFSKEDVFMTLAPEVTLMLERGLASSTSLPKVVVDLVIEYFQPTRIIQSRNYLINLIDNIAVNKHNCSKRISLQSCAMTIPQERERKIQQEQQEQLQLKQRRQREQQEQTQHLQDSFCSQTLCYEQGSRHLHYEQYFI